MKKITFKTLLAALFVVFTVSCIAVPSFSENSEIGNTYSYTQIELEDGTYKFVTLDENGEYVCDGLYKGPNSKADTVFDDVESSYFPSAYYSMNTKNKNGDSIISPVKNQRDGTCWAYSATSAAETAYLRNNNKLDEKGFSGSHNAYFGYTQYISNPSDPTKYEGQNYSNLYSRGGNYLQSSCAYAKWEGPINTLYVSNVPWLVNNQTGLLYFNENERYISKEHLTKSIVVNGANNLKKAIMDYGGAQICFYENGFKQISPAYAVMNSSTAWLEEQFEKYTTNHCVFCVGWNDSVPVANGKFGAWLCKNSWGETSGMKGYFWLSYYDYSFINPCGVVYDFENEDVVDNNYQYDGSWDNLHYNYKNYDYNKISSANVFTSNGYEILKEIGFYSLNSDFDYIIEIFKNPNKEDGLYNPYSGKKCSTATGSFQNEGYYVVEVPNFELEPGDVFSVVLTLKSNDNYNAYAVIADPSYTYSEKNQSFMNWTSNRTKGWVQSEYNMIIKAFTKNKYRRTNGELQTIYKKAVNENKLNDEISEYAQSVLNDPKPTKQELNNAINLIKFKTNYTYNTINYNLFGGTGIQNVQVKWPGERIKIISKAPKKTGYDFLGYSTSSKSNRISYNPDDRYNEDKDLTLYAVYEAFFDDLVDGSWYFDQSIWCYENGFMTGTGDKIFSPSANLTRGQIVIILAKIAGADLSQYSNRKSFNDVAKGKWYHDGAEWAYENGITSGVGEGNFNPNGALSREQLAVMLYAFANKYGKDMSITKNITSLRDYSKISNWAKNQMAWCVSHKLLTGTTDSTLSPKSTATRAQAAVISYSYYKTFAE